VEVLVHNTVTKREKIGEALIRMGFMTKEDVQEVLHCQKTKTACYSAHLQLNMGFIDENSCRNTLRIMA